MNRKQESSRKQIDLLERSLADLEEQIALLRPTPPVNLLRQKEHFEEEIQKIRASMVEEVWGPIAGRPISSEAESFLDDDAPLIKELARRYQTHFNRIDGNKI